MQCKVVQNLEPQTNEVHDFFMRQTVTETNLHIGKMIRQELGKQGRKMSWFAVQIHCDRTNAYRILQRKNMDLELLIRISQVLEHNFVADVARLVKT